MTKRRAAAAVRRSQRRAAAREGKPSPIASFAEYSRVRQQISDEEVLHLLLLQKPLDWFYQPKFNLGFHNLSS
eukprot:SAG11_NODE_6816_length_1242_cov_0.940507_1_plen_72_part_10